MKLRIKDGVRLNGLRPEAIQIILAAARVWQWYDEPELVVTSAVRDPGPVQSLHPHGLAVDLRRWTNEDPEQLVKALAMYLGGDYQVLLESDHIHVEYDPDRSGRPKAG